jgi:hypothetical protein
MTKHIIGENPRGHVHNNPRYAYSSQRIPREFASWTTSRRVIYKITLPLIYYSVPCLTRLLHWSRQCLPLMPSRRNHDCKLTLAHSHPRSQRKLPEPGNAKLRHPLRRAQSRIRSGSDVSGILVNRAARENLCPKDSTRAGGV